MWCSFGSSFHCIPFSCENNLAYISHWQTKGGDLMIIMMKNEKQCPKVGCFYFLFLICPKVESKERKREFKNNQN